MRLRQLEYFDAVLARGSLKKASESLYVAIPTLSQQLRLLEEELGVQLLRRRGRSVAPTPEGEQLSRDVKRVLSATEDLRRHAAELAGRLASHLHIGTTHSGAITVLPGILAALRREHPHLVLHIEEGSTFTILDEVASGRLDVGLVAVSPEVPMDRGDIVRDVVLMGELTLCCAPSMRTTLPDGITLDDLRRVPLILFHPGTLVHELVRRVLPPDVLATASVYYTDNSDSARQMVTAGMGVAFLPDYAAVNDLYHLTGKLRYVRFAERPAPIGIAVVYPAERYVPALVQRFVTGARLEAKRFQRRLRPRARTAGNPHSAF